MYTEAVTHYSQSLGRDMHMMIYGHDGLPFLAFPTQDSMCRNYEDFGMIDQLSDYLEFDSALLKKGNIDDAIGHTVEEGDVISDIAGPLGKATEMEGLKKVCVVGGGVGCAIAYPIAKEMHARGIDVTFIGGFRSADIVILKEELKAASDKLIICTDDGTYGEKGFTTHYLQKEIDENIAQGKPQFDRVIAIGPDIMMKFLADVTRPYGISTIISLDPIMVDGTGMCGCCRVIVGGETKFACVDGPDFDALQVDFDSLIKRASFYKDEQEEAARHICRITGGKRNG